VAVGGSGVGVVGVIAVLGGVVDAGEAWTTAIAVPFGHLMLIVLAENAGILARFV
jgi:hypothetical protein